MLPGYASVEADAAYAEKISGMSTSAATSSSQSVTTAAATSTTTTPRMSLPIAELPLARLREIVFAPSLLRMLTGCNGCTYAFVWANAGHRSPPGSFLSLDHVTMNCWYMSCS